MTIPTTTTVESPEVAAARAVLAEAERELALAERARDERAEALAALQTEADAAAHVSLTSGAGTPTGDEAEADARAFTLSRQLQRAEQLVAGKAASVESARRQLADAERAAEFAELDALAAQQRIEAEHIESAIASLVEQLVALCLAARTANDAAVHAAYRRFALTREPGSYRDLSPAQARMSAPRLCLPGRLAVVQELAAGRGAPLFVGFPSDLCNASQVER